MHNAYDKNSIDQVFDTIPPYYDRMNAIMSLGMHQSWKQHAMSKLYPLPTEALYVDLASGSGDLAYHFLGYYHPSQQWLLIDPSTGMLDIAQKRFTSTPAHIHTVCAYAEHLPLASRSVHTLTMGFGLRNTTNRLDSLQEIYRVLESGGQCMILEFFPPDGLVGQAFALYQTLLPLMGEMVTGDSASYAYLADSIASMPKVEYICETMAECGFKNIVAHNIFGGMVYALHATKDIL
jgi:demethylmenaquinone methyltransferase/2-methoxy-6-polyprenyl-1,4-benzoquinol methylase